MNLECCHLMLYVSDIEQARAFYIDTLEFPVIEDHRGMFAFRAGDVRFSVVGGGTKVDEDTEINPPATILFRTADLDSTVERLRATSVKFVGDIEIAPGFMKHIALLDPDNNMVYIAEYLRDPLQLPPSPA